MNATSWPRRWRLAGARIATLDPEGRIFDGAIDIADGKIVALGPTLPPLVDGTPVIERPGHLVVPGFVQAHVHVCQTLFRGLAAERRLDRWLNERIFPLEAALDADTIAAASRLGIALALRAGATTIVDMGTVRHTEIILEAARELGIRALVGGALMDVPVPNARALQRPPSETLSEALALHARWDGGADGRLGVALAPRFTLSVTARFWEQIAVAARAHDMLIHTHVSETEWENETAREMHGDSPIRLLERWGVLNARTLLVHAVWIDDEEREILARRNAAVVHCPGSNARLGSGICDIAALRENGITVALGSDGAACNDNLSPTDELRLAAQLASLLHGPGRLSDAELLAMATRDGAAAAGLGAVTGSLEVGKHADFILYDVDDAGWEPDGDPAQALVHASSGVRPAAVFVDGEPRVWDGEMVGIDWAAIRNAAQSARESVLARVEKGEGSWTYRGN